MANQITKKFYLDIDLVGNAIKNMALEALATAPTENVKTGRFYLNTTEDALYFYSSTGSWVKVGDTAAIQQQINSLSSTISLIDSGQDSLISEQGSILADLSSIIDDTDSDVIPSIEDAISNLSTTAQADYNDISISLSNLESAHSSDINSIESSISTINSNIVNTSVSLSEHDSLISSNTTQLSIAISTIDLVSSDTSDSIASIVATLGTDGATLSAVSAELTDVSSEVSSINDLVTDISNSQIADSTLISSTIVDLAAHLADGSNPHSVTLAQVLEAGNIADSYDIDMNGNQIKNVGSPVDDNDAANKAYVDAVAQGLKVRQSVDVATVGELIASYSNGPGGGAEGATLTNNFSKGPLAALTIDGILATPGMRVLVKNQTNPVENGIYTVTTVGDASTPWVLTRSGNWDDTPANELADGDYFFVMNGTVNQHTGWVLSSYNNADPVVGTDPLVFVQFSGAGTFTGVGPIDITGTQISFEAASAADTGLEVGSSSEKLKVTRYTPITDGYVERAKIFTNVAITTDMGSYFQGNITHGFDSISNITVTVFDGAYPVEVNYEVNATDVIIYSSVSFTATKVVVKG